MTHIYTKELSGAALDWAVAKCEGLDFDILTSPACVALADRDSWGKRRVLDPLEGGDNLYSPSSNWAQGGMIIDRRGIQFMHNLPCSQGREWEARPAFDARGAGGRWGYGPTHLIAAMRCYVASELGDETDVPEELLK